MKKHSSLFYSLLILFTLMVIQVSDFYFKIHILSENKLEKQTVLLHKAEYSIEKIANFTYENLLNTHQIRNLLKDINTNSKEENAVVRNKLYAQLLDSYNNFKNYNIQQLHFHRKNNDSFLRFHKPKKFGDNLTDIRSTVKYVNEFQQATKGFEEGRIFSGYRFVYPLFDNNNEHIGSVEVSSSLVSYKKFLEKDKDLTIDYVMDKKVISQKVFDSEKSNYHTYTLNSDYAIRDIQLEYDSKRGNHISHKKEFLEQLSLDSSITKKMKNKETFYSLDFMHQSPHITSFIPLLNGITNEKVGYIIIVEHNSELEELLTTFVTELLFFILLSTIIGIFLSTQIKLKETSNALSQKYKIMLDLTDNLVVVYENNKIYSLNHSFLQFHNVDHFSALEHNDITKYFIKKQKHNYPTNLDELKKMLTDKNSLIIFMMNEDKFEIETFEVNIYYINQKDGNFILEFKNITELYTENIALEKKANYDKLTNLYNRHSFEKIFLDKFKIMKKYNTNLSMIMFDIDHFKIINDEYGHILGDESLKFLSNLVSHHIRKEDTLCRWGGEEFIILMNSDLKTSAKAAEHLRTTIYNETEKEADIPQFSCSFGVASLSDVNTTTQAIEKVDALLYESKQSGRNKVSS